MPHVFEVADRIQIMRFGRRVALTSSRRHTMSDVVPIMTGAARGDEPPAAPNGKGCGQFGRPIDRPKFDRPLTGR